MAKVLSTKTNVLREQSLEGKQLGSGLNKHGENFYQKDRESLNKKAGVDGLTGAAITKKGAELRAEARKKKK
jgi:Na+-transporting NADH:ubiquinone oxidoreductase subunit NqrC